MIWHAVSRAEREIAARGPVWRAARRRVVRRLNCASFIERNKAAARNQTYCMAKARGQKPPVKLDAQGKVGGEHAAAKAAAKAAGGGHGQGTARRRSWARGCS